MTRITDIGCRIGKAHTLLQIKVRADRAISPEQTALIEREMDRILAHNVDAIRLLTKTINEFA